jgi:hypothetical protein
VLYVKNGGTKQWLIQENSFWVEKREFCNLNLSSKMDSNAVSCS